MQDKIHRDSNGLRLKALGASAGLSVLFLVVYFWCNWFTAQRDDVGRLCFGWERFIPFVPLMIVPYMSIDLFFVAAPFFCRDERDLATFSKRVVAAIVVAGICFLLFPLRFALERPEVRGWLGAIFDWFRGIDQPFNLLPSLHIAFQVILAQHYARHTRGFWRGALNAWFVLVALSTLLTYQHHLMDVVAGFALGVYCIYFIREPVPKPPLIQNRRVGLYYATAGLGLAGMGVWLWPWGALLFWPAMALGVVAAAYLGWGSHVFHKIDGRVHWSARMVLAPCLLGQQLSLFYYRRQCRPWDKVTPVVWIGRTLSHHEASAAARLGVTAVLDLTAEFSESNAFRTLVYRSIPVLDLTAPTIDQLQEMVQFIEDESRKGVVYVHCKIGYSRTAAAIAAYLLQSGKASSVAEAVELLRQVRPSIVVRPEVISALVGFAEKTRLFSAKGALPLQPGAAPQETVPRNS